MMCRMSQFWTAGIMHLTKVNRYMTDALHAKPPAAGASAHLPRQVSGAALAGGTACGGVSGFAFQGSHAHVILARSAASLAGLLSHTPGNLHSNKI